MIGFYCSTAFHIFLSVLIKYKYFDQKQAVLYIVSPLNINDYNVQVLYELGFNDILFVSNEEEVDVNRYSFEQVFFYTLFCHNVQYLKKLVKGKLILAYEGITTFQLRNWSESDSLKRINLETDIDEIWLPNLNLLLDKEYLYKCKEFNVSIHEQNNDMLANICSEINKVFGYKPYPINSEVVFIDRYLTRYINVFSDIEYERMLTQSIYYGAGKFPVIKKHPYDAYYEVKYRNLDQVTIISDNVPWELVYLNNKINNSNFGVTKYIIYNSFAPANLALLFNDNSFECICIEPLLDKYSCIENTFLNMETTYQILSLFSKECKVSVRLIDSLDEYWNIESKESLCTNDTLWNCMEMCIEDDGKKEKMALRAFRLQLDCALLSVKKKKGFYWFNANNSSADITREVLKKVVPDFTETFQKSKADIIIDCDGTMVDYSVDDFDIRNFHVLESIGRLKKWEITVERLLCSKEHIYIWGAGNTNEKTFEFIKKVCQQNKVRKVFDTYVKGTSRDYKIVPFEPDGVEPNSYIFICANVAYPEISKRLIQLGYREYIDFGPGIGVSISGQEVTNYK